MNDIFDSQGSRDELICKYYDVEQFNAMSCGMNLNALSFIHINVLFATILFSGHLFFHLDKYF